MSNPTPPAGNDAALIRIKRRHAADRKTVAPMRVRHDVGRLNDAGKHRDIGRLFTDLVVHVADQILVGENDDRHAHRALRIEPPSRRIDADEASRVHRRCPYTSTTQAADHRRSESSKTFSAV